MQTSRTITNTTDSTYHFTEIAIIHDGTDTYMTETGTMFTGTAAEATFTSDISSGSVRLLATPASTDSMTFKVVRQMLSLIHISEPRDRQKARMPSSA